MYVGWLAVASWSPLLSSPHLVPSFCEWVWNLSIGSKYCWNIRWAGQGGLMVCLILSMARETLPTWGVLIHAGVDMHVFLLVYICTQSMYVIFLRAGQHPKGWIVTNRFLTLLLRPGDLFFFFNKSLDCYAWNRILIDVVYFYVYTLAEKLVVRSTVGPAGMCCRDTRGKVLSREVAEILLNEWYAAWIGRCDREFFKA